MWVPFELGRPFGAPGNAAFQQRVLLHALGLLERESGPIIEDFPEDEPPTTGERSGWACPITYTHPPEKLSGVAKLETALVNEIMQFAPWYDRAIETRGRTTVGISGLSMTQIATLLTAMLANPLPVSPNPDLELADAVRLSAEDLKAYYLEAASAQPGDAGHDQLNSWFWGNTFAAKILQMLKARCLESDDDSLRILGVVLLVPFKHAELAKQSADAVR